MEKGQGLGQLIPPVGQSDYPVHQSAQLACIIRNGMKGEVTVNGVTYAGEMAGNSQLSDVEISNIVHYLLVELNSTENPYTITDIRAQLESCKE